MQTDAEGELRFESVKLGEYVLTVEAEGFAPEQRHIKVEPEARPQDFRLKPGRLVRGKVVDERGKTIGGVCVLLNLWHCHTDPRGFFHWSVEAPAPEQVTLRAYKRYSGQYETLETSVSFSEVESQPIILQNR